MTLRIFAITKPGLVALGIAVAALWTCVGAETVTRRLADRDTIVSIRTLARLRRLAPSPALRAPVRAPLPAFRRDRPYAS